MLDLKRGKVYELVFGTLVDEGDILVVEDGDVGLQSFVDKQRKLGVLLNGDHGEEWLEDREIWVLGDLVRTKVYR